MVAFAEEFLDQQARHWKSRTLESNAHMVRKYIRPAFANLNHAFEILRAMMFRAEEWGLRERCTNPCLGIAKNPRRNVTRFLDATN